MTNFHNDSNIRQIESFVNDASKITVITGAGISTSCGIPDFRGPDGLYSRRDIDADKIFDIGYFSQNPSYFYSVMKDIMEAFLNAEPSSAHNFITQLEKSGKLEMLITQNIDGLHEKSGTEKIIRLHGSYDTMICRKCGLSSSFAEHFPFKSVPGCTVCGSILKPDIVFFGENVKDMEKASESVRKCDLLLAIGTSFTVYPAAYLPELRKPGSPFIIVNSGRTQYDYKCTLKIDGDIEETFRAFFNQV